MDVPHDPRSQRRRSYSSAGTNGRCGIALRELAWTEDVETRTVCLTEDGVLLRFVSTASRFRRRIRSYRGQPAELFQVPRGYTPLLAPKEAPSREAIGAE